MTVADDQMRGIEYERGRKRKLAVRSRSTSTDRDSRSVRAKQELTSGAEGVSFVTQREEQMEEEQVDTTADTSTTSDAATYLRTLLLELPETHPQYDEIKELAQFLACLTDGQDVVMLEST